MNDPIDRIQWRSAEDLKANDWNPNRVLKAEWRLLERNLLSLGWVQPLLISPDDQIIDGFHRWRLSLDSKKVRDKYDGLVPCVVIDVDEYQARILTIRMNRAKGVHQASAVAEIARDLVSQGYTPTQVKQELGMSQKELDLMLAESVFEARNIKDWKYSKAWYPTEDTA